MAVQACHAAIDASRHFLSVDSDHPHLVLCSVASEERLLAAADHLFQADIRYHLFREPDRDNEATALATEPLRGELRRKLERYRCLNAADFHSISPSLSPALQRSTTML
jgi:hypothetical protein